MPETVIVRLERQGSTKTGDGKIQVHLELKTDGSAFVIEADSLKEAISKLNEQVKALSKKSTKSVQDKKKAEALDKAVKALADSVKKIDEANSSAKLAKGKVEQKIVVLKQLEGKLQDEKRAVIRKIEQGKKISAENAARSEAKAKDLKGFFQARVNVDERLSDDKKAAEKMKMEIRTKVKVLSKELEQKRRRSWPQPRRDCPNSNTRAIASRPDVSHRSTRT